MQTTRADGEGEKTTLKFDPFARRGSCLTAENFSFSKGAEYLCFWLQRKQGLKKGPQSILSVTIAWRIL